MVSNPALCMKSLALRKLIIHAQQKLHETPAFPKIQSNALILS
jgi:hypothetical protein